MSFEITPREQQRAKASGMNVMARGLGGSGARGLGGSGARGLEGSGLGWGSGARAVAGGWRLVAGGWQLH